MRRLPPAVRRHLLLACAVLLGGRLALAEESFPWADEDLVRRRFAEARDLAEKAVGAKFEKAPSVRLAKPTDVEALVREEVVPLLGALGLADQAEAVVVPLSRSMLAKYDPAAHAVLVLPENVRRLAKDLAIPALETEDVLRVVLVHEATHALDFPRHGLVETRRSRDSVDALEAYGAVVEGHAQLVAEEVADSIGLSEAFRAYTRSISAVPKIDDPVQKTMAEAVAARVSFGYVQGHAFLKAVLAEKGREGVEKALREPPTTRRAIENPKAWLAGALGSGPDPHGALGTVAPLVADPVWRLEVDDMLRVVLASQLGSVDAARRESVLSAYRGGAVLVADHGKEGDRLIAAVLEFDSAEKARDFATIEREISVSRDAPSTGSAKVLSATYADGAGKDAKRLGFTLAKRVAVGPQELALEGQFLLVDRFLIETIAIGSKVPFSRAAIDEVLERMAAVLEGKAPAAPRLARRAARGEVPTPDEGLDDEGD
jgi:hypothetical protein